MPVGALLILVSLAGFRLYWALPHGVGSFGIISGVPYHVPTGTEAACSAIFALGSALIAGQLIVRRKSLLPGLLVGLVLYAAIGIASTGWMIARAGEPVSAIAHPYVLMTALSWPERLASAG